MARRKSGTPEQQARRALIGELLSTANVQSVDDIQSCSRKRSLSSWRVVLKPSSMRNWAMSLMT